MVSSGACQTDRAYPGDVTDEEWAPVAPYLTLMTEEIVIDRWLKPRHRDIVVAG